MFIGREHELQVLEQCYSSGGFQMVPIWGRRRVGKTRLINEFVADKPHVWFFTAGETTSAENLARLSRALHGWYDPRDVMSPDFDAPIYPSYEAALSHAFAEAADKRVVLVIDEYPYLAKAYPGISSLLQGLIDTHKDASRLMIVLCGSSMSFMEHQVLGEKSPLYGRRTAQLRLDPFDYLDASSLLGTDDPQRAVELYALVGGVPLYLEQLDAKHTTEWNIANNLLGQGRFLYAEPKSFLLQEVSSPAPYTAVIDAIAHGRPRPSEIADGTGIPSPNVNEYLKRLGELGIVKRCTPVGHANKKQVIYRLSDNLFCFWHTFVPRYEQAIEQGSTVAVARRITSRDLAAYVGHAFEEICRQWIVRQMVSGGVDMLPSHVGMWWGTDLETRAQADVDVVVLGVDGELLCGECKWTAEQVDAMVIETLARRARSVIQKPASTQLFVFSKSGFAPSARREADRLGNVRLVAVDELFAK